jgi:NitT/TauT family transport system substrate-binding protein
MTATRTSRTPRGGLVAGLVACVAITVPSVLAAQSEAELTPVRYSFDWLPDGDWAPLLWAEENGYFEEEGLAVEAVAGDGSATVLPLLAQGAIDLAQLSAPPVVLSVGEELPITAVGVQMPSSPNVVIADGSIATPQDLVGRTAAVQVGGFEEALWQAWLVANGIDRGDVEEVPVGEIAADVLFVDHQVDAIVDFHTSGVIPGLTDGREGDETLFPIRDSLNVIGHVTAVNDDFLAREPEAVRAFLRAWARGMDYTIEHPEESVELILGRFPENDRVATEWSVARYVEAWLNDQARSGGYLSFTPEMWDETKRVLVEGGLMEDVDLTALYDTGYVPDPPILPTSGT